MDLTYCRVGSIFLLSPRTRPCESSRILPFRDEGNQHLVADTTRLWVTSSDLVLRVVKKPCQMRSHLLGMGLALVLVASFDLGWAKPTAAAAGKTKPTAPTAAAAAAGKPKRDLLSFLTAYDARLGLAPERLKDKQALLASHPFLFYRATPALFHHDVQGTWADVTAHHSASVLVPTRASPRITIMADMHLGNFGSVRAPNGEAVFGEACPLRRFYRSRHLFVLCLWAVTWHGVAWHGMACGGAAINDYDQAGAGRAEVDLTRLAASVVLAARSNALSTEQALPLVTRLGITRNPPFHPFFS
jgi:hypothetical protein